MPGNEYGLPDRVTCPFCDGNDTELHSPFGTALSVATYWCRRCHTAFEWVKWKRVGEETAGPGEA